MSLHVAIFVQHSRTEDQAKILADSRYRLVSDTLTTDKPKETTNVNSVGAGIAIGAAIGVAFGAAMGNLGNSPDRSDFQKPTIRNRPWRTNTKKAS